MIDVWWEHRLCLHYNIINYASQAGICHYVERMHLTGDNMCKCSKKRENRTIDVKNAQYQV